MEENLKSYLKTMELKTKVLGGYDPEDVVLKMTEVAKLARSEERQQWEQDFSAQAEKLRQAEDLLDTTAAKLHQTEDLLETTSVRLRQTEDSLKNSTEKLSRTEDSLETTAANLSRTESALESALGKLRQVEAEKNRVEEELSQLRAQLAAQPEPTIPAAPEEETLFSQESDAEKLRILLASIEDAKEDILHHYKAQAIQDADRIREESSLMEQKNQQLRKMLEEDSQVMAEALDALLEQAHQMKEQLTHLRTNENGNTESQQQ